MPYKYIMHSDEESKSKYKGGFIKGKNTSEYNHDYYIHNKEKWARTAKGKLEDISRWWKVAEKGLYRFLTGNQNAVKQPTKMGVESVSGATTGLNVKTKQPGKKYLYRVTYKGKYRYFYTETEYYSFLKNTKKKQGNYSVEDDCAAINEDYPSDGHTMNCPSCALAYDMRRRGYDVKAISISNGMKRKEILNFWKDAQFTTVKGSSKDYQTESKKVVDELKSYGEGARGTISVNWNTGGGHILNWENIGGQTYFIDGQSNTVLPDWKFQRTTSQNINFETGVMYLRTDNLELSQYIADAELFEDH